MVTSSFNGKIDVFLASAGTGKTTALLEQIKDCDPQTTRFVTFSKAGTIQARHAAPLSISTKALKTMFTTIHSFCFRSLGMSRQVMFAGVKKMRALEQRVGLDLCGTGLEDGDIELTWAQQKSRMYITLENMRRVNPEQFEKMKTLAHIDLSKFSWFLQQYVSFKKENGYFDFTDLLEKYYNESKNYEENIETLCVDEAQDLSPLQWKVLLKAYVNCKQIYIAGDDKQALFTFAGASPTTFASFRGEQHFLDVSYRVPSVILDFANTVANNLSNRLPTNCKSSKEGGFVEHIPTLEGFSLYPRKTYLMLARNRLYLNRYIKWCQERGILYQVDFQDPFKPYDYFDFEQKNNMYERWPDWKKDYFNRVQNIRDKPYVNITTIHSCKGTEADYVVLASDISKNVAVGLSKDPDSEHRVFYVGCTRAKKGLYIIEPQTKLYYRYLIG